MAASSPLATHYSAMGMSSFLLVLKPTGELTHRLATQEWCRFRSRALQFQGPLPFSRTEKYYSLRTPLSSCESQPTGRLIRHSEYPALRSRARSDYWSTRWQFSQTGEFLQR